MNPRNPHNPQRRRLACGLALVLAGPTRLLAHGNNAHAPPPPAGLDDTQHPWGRQGFAGAVVRSVNIHMSDRMRFTPERLQVKRGQTLRLRVHNRGRLQHELVIGTIDSLRRHAELMKQHPDMEHGEAYMAHVAPGASAELVWNFNRPGRFHFGCLVAGHWDAGMVGNINVKE